MIRVVLPGSGSWFFTHPGSWGQKGTGTRIRIRNTVFFKNIRQLSRLLLRNHESYSYTIFTLWYLYFHSGQAAFRIIPTLLKVWCSSSITGINCMGPFRKSNRSGNGSSQGTQSAVQKYYHVHFVVPVHREQNLHMDPKLKTLMYRPVLRIHDILGWIRIRIRGSKPLTNGSGFGSGSRSWILLFSSMTFKMPAKN